MNRTVMWLTWRQLFARKRVWFAAAFSLAPLVFAVGFLLIGDDGPGARLGFFTALNRDIVLGTLMPLAALIFGSTAFGGEVDDGTLVYLLVKPIARWEVVTSKYVVAVLSTLAVTVPSVVLPWLLLRDADVTARGAAAFLLAALVGSMIYCALFLSLGLASRRALAVGLLYVIGFEGLLSRGLTGAKSLSVREFTVSIARAASGGSLSFAGYVVPMSTVYWMGTIIFLAAMVWTMRKLVRFELAERV